MLFLSILFSITPAKAAFSSFVLPGSGDWLMGDKKRGACFILAEAGIWLTYFDSKREANKIDEISKNYASYYAAANLNRQDNEYFDVMAHYMTNLDYNETVKEEARALYPDTLDAEILRQRRLYIENNSYVGEDAWQWQSQEFADDYKDLRRKKRKSTQKATNMIGLALANRAVSFFTTYFFGKRVSVGIKENEIEVGFRF